MKRNLILSFCLIFLTHFCSFSQLIPDSTYGQNGYFITNYAGLGTFAYKLHEYDNGELLAIGTSTGELRLWKYDATGQLITSFGTNGIASNPTMDAEPGNFPRVNDYAILNNGKIIVLSRYAINNFNSADSNQYFITLSSFNADGSIDNSFNGNGYKIDRPDSLFEFNPFALLIDEKDNNKLYVGGESYERWHASCPMGTGKWFVSKYKMDGSLDTDFNSTGYLIDNAQTLKQGSTSSPHARVRDMAFMNNGSIRVVGMLHNFDQSFFDMALKPNGTFDSTFGTNGRTIHPVNFSVLHNEVGTWAKILADTSILFYTTSYTATDATVRMVKNKNDGTIDTSYGASGVFEFTFPALSNPRLIYKSNNNVLLTYYKPYGTDQKIEFIHLLSSGEVDSTFGTNGILQTQPITPDIYVNQSQMFDGIWNKYETHIYLAASKQPVTYNSYGIFKYKWPGLTPLSTSNIESNSERFIVYPNPIQKGQSLYISNISVDDDINLFSIDGKQINVLPRKNSSSLCEINIPNECVSGIYYLIIKNNQQQQNQLIVVQ